MKYKGLRKLGLVKNWVFESQQQEEKKLGVERLGLKFMEIFRDCLEPLK